MAWREINPRFLKQRPGEQRRWYCDEHSASAGGLHLWLDNAGRVIAFHLDFDQGPSHHHYAAAWRAGELVRIGSVDEGEYGGLGIKQSALLRFVQPDAEGIANRLRQYFQAHAGCLDPAHRATIAAVLGEACDATPTAA